MSMTQRDLIEMPAHEFAARETQQEQEARQAADEAYQPPVPGPEVSPEEAHYQASLILRKIRRLAAAVKVIQASRKDQVAEIDQWALGELEPLEREMDWLERSLEPWAKVVIAADPKSRKSVTLAHGKVGYQDHGGVSTKVTDNDVAVAWLNEHGFVLLIRTTREPAIAAIKDSAQVVDGRYVLKVPVAGPQTMTFRDEAIPGIEAIPGAGDTFYVKPKDGRE